MLRRVQILKKSKQICRMEERVLRIRVDFRRGDHSGAPRFEQRLTLGEP